jgi:hypothetical protein
MQAMNPAGREAQDMMSTKQLECWIRRSLGVGGFLALISVLSAALWGMLHAMGDHSGSAGARIVTWWSIGIWVADIVALVVLVACRVLSENDRPAADPGVADRDAVTGVVE